MGTSIMQALVRHHAIVSDWLNQDGVRITDYAVSEYRISFTVQDATSLRQIYYWLAPTFCPEPRVTVYQGEKYRQFGAHAFLTVTGLYGVTEVAASVLVTGTGLPLTRTTPGLALIEALASTETQES